MRVDGPPGSAPQPGQSGVSFCFRLRQERRGWHALHLVPSKKTSDLATLVSSAPEFLGIGGASAPCHAAATLSERGYARVLAAVDEAGGIQLVGCTSELTRAALTTVAQELLAFNGRLWRMSVEEFSKVFEKALGRNLADHVSSRVAIGWSEKSFRAGLKESLEEGRFPVVLLLDGTNQEVADAFDHLQSHNLPVRLLGVEVFDCDGLEVVMPKLLASTEPGVLEAEESATLVERQPEPEPAYAKVEPEPESEPDATGKMPWSDLPSPTPEELEAPAVEETADSSAGEYEPEPEAAAETEEREEPVVEQAAEESGPEPGQRTAVAGPPPPARLKPVAGKPPAAPRPAQIQRAAYDGTMPGIMAGKRPPPKPAGTPESRKEQEEQARKGRD